MRKKHKVRRSAETGKWVSKEEADANPKETVSETVEAGSDNKEDGDVKQSGHESDSKISE